MTLTETILGFEMRPNSRKMRSIKIYRTTFDE